jgi:hypothetical protein
VFRPHSFLWHYLWLAPPVVLAVIVVVMAKRKLYREYPAFFAYACWQMIFNNVMFVLDHATESVTTFQYQLSSYTHNGVSILLRFAIIYEIFSIVFRPYRALRQWALALFSVGLVVLLLVAVIISHYSPNADYATRFLGAMFILNRAIGIVQCGLLIMLFVFASYFKLSWDSYIYGIAIGLGIFASVQIVVSALVARSQQSQNLNFVIMGTYHVCVVIWALYLLAPEPALRSVPAVPSVDLESWNTEVQRYLRQ